MIGELSKWTMSYFAIAIVWLIAAEALMAAGFGFPAADIASADTLVVVHVVCIGWLSMAMCGALFQFVPVLVGRPLFDERWELPALILLTAGLAALLAGFLALGGRLPGWLWLFPLAASLLVGGFALVLAKLYKIVAFLTWIETYGPAMGQAPTPRVQDLVSERRASKWFAAYFACVWSGTAALLFGQGSAFRGVVLLMTVATVGIVRELIRTRRLADVAEPLRLPKATRAPRLLRSRR